MHAAFPSEMTIEPISDAAGQVELPGSKSISNRALLLAALASGSTELTGLLDAEDTQVMIAALRQLGVQIEHDAAAQQWQVVGNGGEFANKNAELFLGNAGTAMRPLAAALAFSGGRYRLDGVARMRERPIGDLVDALNAAGASIQYLGQTGYPPLLIEPAARQADANVAVRGDVSSQFVSSLLMIAPLIAGTAGLRIEVPGTLISQPYVHLTLAMMRQFGVAVRQVAPTAFHVPRAGYQAPARYAVEGDASGASYFLALGLLAGGPVRVQGVGQHSPQGDIAFANLLQAQGAQISWGEHWIEARRAGPLQPVDYDCSAIPDAAMTAAVVAAFAPGRTVLRGIASWRVKETDRIAAISNELQKLGAQVETGPDWLAVTGPTRFRAATIKTYDDHRIAMCFSLAAAGGVPIRLLDPGCVAKTFPDFFTRLNALLGRGSAPNPPLTQG